MSQAIHNVFVLSDSPTRKTLIKSCFAISLKRAVGFKLEEGVLQSGTELLLCDLGSSETFLAASKAIRERQRTGRELTVIFIYDAVSGMEAARELVRKAGLESAWKPDLSLDSKINWVKLLGVLEHAVKKPTAQVESFFAPYLAVAAEIAKVSASETTPVARESQQQPPAKETMARAPAAIPPFRVAPAVWPPRPLVAAPAAVAPWRAAPPATAEAPVDGRKAVEILLVDDSESARQFVMSKLLATWDRKFAFDVAKTGQEAKEKCQEKKYDILFLDVMLPDLDGYAVCKNLKNTKNINSLAVMLTSKGGAFDKLKGMMSGCDMYLVKPLDEASIKQLAKKFTTEYT